MEFSGFSEKTIQFFLDLSMQNEREWFTENRKIYDNYVLEPARAFVVEMGHRLHTLSDGFYAIPKVNKSLFRVNRDTRFSKDKSPYKTHLGILMWEGNIDCRMECPGFYFHIEPDSIFIGGGMHGFSKEVLTAWRTMLTDAKKVKEINTLIQDFTSDADFQIGGEKYKRHPRGFEVTEQNKELLLLKGLWTSYALKDNEIDILFSHELVDFIFEKYTRMYPIHKFLLEVYRQSL